MGSLTPKLICRINTTGRSRHVSKELYGHPVAKAGTSMKKAITIPFSPD
jgi:hypothetical protein